MAHQLASNLRVTLPTRNLLPDIAPHVGCYLRR